jgi:hypothetical protein
VALLGRTAAGVGGWRWERERGGEGGSGWVSDGSVDGEWEGEGEGEWGRECGVCGGADGGERSRD